ncbi:uncharacterized protein LOC143460525 [Clavelina lepadiformis]|uniref:uncharacterized protein LOC143460525 n=1 Tax=Clavelina lepadiformis TaxID=159417 RepID=UPI0040422A4B
MWKILTCIAVVLVVYQFKITTADGIIDGSQEPEIKTANTALNDDITTTPAATARFKTPPRPKTLKINFRNVMQICMKSGACKRLNKSMRTCNNVLCIFCQKAVCNSVLRKESPL